MEVIFLFSKTFFFLVGGIFCERVGGGDSAFITQNAFQVLIIENLCIYYHLLVVPQKVNIKKGDRNTSKMTIMSSVVFYL